MADNVLVQIPPSGVTVPIATDEVAGTHFQRVKLDVGGDGATVPVVGTVPVSGTVTATGPLTDTQLRAMPVPIYSLPVELQATMTGFADGKAATVVTVIGRRAAFSSATVFQDVCQFLVGGQAAYTEPAVGTTYYAVSTSANDKAASAGVSKLRLVSLDATGVQQVTSITLNGTTAVSIGSGYTFFQWIETSELGAGGLVAAGDITISSVNGVATEATTMLIIKAGGNKSLDGKYRVPTGYTAYGLGWDAMAINQDMDTRIRATCFSDDRTLSDGIFHSADTFYVPSGITDEASLFYQKYIAGVTIKVSTLPKATTGSPRCDSTVHLLLIAV